MRRSLRAGGLSLSFERLFHPRGIAIIGASADITRIGSHPLKALKNAGTTDTEKLDTTVVINLVYALI